MPKTKKSIDIDKTVEALIRERDVLDRIIVALLRLKEARGGSRGRPPAWVARAKALQQLGRDPKAL